MGTTAALLFIDSLEKIAVANPLLAAGIALLAAACVVLFLRQERRASEPLLDLALFRNGSFVVGVTAAGMMTFAMQGAMVFLPLYFQAVQDQTPTHSGLMLIAQISGMIVSSIIGGQLSARSGQFKAFLIAGVTMEMLALTSLAILACVDARPPAFLLALGLLGLGTGLGMPNAVVIIQNSVDRSVLGIATASMSFLRSLGGSLGVALSGCVMHFTLATSAAQTKTALRLAIASSFALGASMMLLAVTAIASNCRHPSGDRGIIDFGASMIIESYDHENAPARILSHHRRRGWIQSRCETAPRRTALTQRTDQDARGRSRRPAIRTQQAPRVSDTGG